MAFVTGSLDISQSAGTVEIIERSGTAAPTPPYIVAPIRGWLAGAFATIRSHLVSQGVPAATLTSLDTVFAQLYTDYDTFVAAQPVPTESLIATTTTDGLTLNLVPTAGGPPALLTLVYDLESPGTGRAYIARTQIQLDRDVLVNKTGNFIWFLQNLLGEP